MSTCPLLPCADYYVLVPDAAPTKTGHIVLNAAYVAPSRVGTVAATGPNTVELRTGDRCAWRPFTGTTVEIGEGLWLLLQEDDIVCRLEGGK